MYRVLKEYGLSSKDNSFIFYETPRTQKSIIEYNHYQITLEYEINKCTLRIFGISPFDKSSTYQVIQRYILNGNFSPDMFVDRDTEGNVLDSSIVKFQNKIKMLLSFM